MNDSTFNPMNSVPVINIEVNNADIMEMNQMSVFSRNQLSIQAPKNVNELRIRSLLEIQS